MHAAERRRPRDEVVAATVLRAVHSRWQLREVMCEFWHDHFNVDALGSEAIGVALPAYDRDVIRRHCFGNFREMLEAAATSTAMQYYLSNCSSRAGAANENYARELFELHTMGRAAYLNDRYDRWRDVPGALEGKPAGYIDQDVYEAARAFTGWTIEDGGAIDAHRRLPQSGQFVYVENWHDGYQKRVLATELTLSRRRWRMAARCSTWWPRTRRPRAFCATNYAAACWARTPPRKFGGKLAAHPVRSGQIELTKTVPRNQRMLN